MNITYALHSLSSEFANEESIDYSEMYEIVGNRTNEIMQQRVQDTSDFLHKSNQQILFQVLQNKVATLQTKHEESDPNYQHYTRAENQLEKLLQLSKKTDTLLKTTVSTDNIQEAIEHSIHLTKAYNETLNALINIKDDLQAALPETNFLLKKMTDNHCKGIKKLHSSMPENYGEAITLGRNLKAAQKIRGRLNDPTLIKQKSSDKSAKAGKNIGNLRSFFKTNSQENKVPNKPEASRDKSNKNKVSKKRKASESPASRPRKSPGR